MSAAIALRDDYDAAGLRKLAKWSDDAAQVRRVLALAVVYDGGSRSEGAEAGGVGLQTFRDWVMRFNAAGPAGLVNGKALGQAPRHRTSISEQTPSWYLRAMGYRKQPARPQNAAAVADFNPSFPDARDARA